MPPDARQDAGYQLERVQRGEQPHDWKPMSTVGPGVREIRVHELEGAFRVIYPGRRPEGIYVLHCFQKKSEQTSRRDMPFTPFHFGAGALVHSVAPKYVSFLAFCGANVLVDVEPLYFMVTHQYPIHRFFHTYLGATIAAAVCVAAFSLAHGVAPRLLDALGLRKLGVRAVALGALAGTYSHVLLDSMMHADMKPFAPFSYANPLLGAVFLNTLHGFCVLAGVVGGVVIAARRLRHTHKNLTTRARTSRSAAPSRSRDL